MKTVHLASKIDQHGNVSALCFKRPRKIDLSKEIWTLRIEAATCKGCIAAHKAKRPGRLKELGIGK